MIVQNRVIRGQDKWTNQILTLSIKQDLSYYLPCYLRFKLKHFVSIDISLQQAVINGDLIIGFYYHLLPNFIIEALKKNIILQFNRDQSLQLAKSPEIALKNNHKNKVLSFTLRRNFKTSVQSNFFLWPFESLKLILIVTIRSLTLQNPLKYGKTILIRFNCMDHQSQVLKCSYNKNISLGSYCLAPKQISVQYSRQPLFDFSKKYTETMTDQSRLLSLQNENGQSLETINDENIDQDSQKEEFIAYYQYGHFVFGVYHYPFVVLFGLFLPMWSLALYNLMIFFQGSDMSMRISNSVFIDLTLLDYIPTIRSQLPDTPNLLLIQILLYSVAFTFHLTIIDSYLVYQNPDYVMDWTTNRLFQISLSISLSTVLIVVVLSVYHKLVWQKAYKTDTQNDENIKKFNRNEWSNRECDAYLAHFKNINILE